MVECIQDLGLRQEDEQVQSQPGQLSGTITQNIRWSGATA